jgi:tRNA G18 (ribose-2'-O)-methylase SpoU
VLVSEPALAALADALDAATPVYVASQEVIRGVVGFNFHRGAIAIGERGPGLSLGDVLAGAPRTVLVCERLSNPDNMGGVFRNAMAFGADAVVLSPGSADPLYRKVIRVAIGGSLVVPFARAERWPDALARLRGAGLSVVALTTRGGRDLATLEPPARAALLVGSEGEGLTDAALAHADLRATIAMAPGVDSLNVAVACGIALWRLAR